MLEHSLPDNFTNNYIVTDKYFLPQVQSGLPYWLGELNSTQIIHYVIPSYPSQYGARRLKKGRMIKVLSRDEKREIRKKITDLLDQYCQSCPNRKEFHKNVCLGCSVLSQIQCLSKHLFDKNNNSEKVLGGVKTGKFTEDEDLYLMNHISHFDVDHISERLGRTTRSVTVRLNYLKQSKKIVF